MKSISRLNFNFSTKCNMQCDYCYMKFDGLNSTLDIWKKIIQRSYELGVRSITFAGGDPFMYKKFSDLLFYTRDIFGDSLFIQVDTNGISLKEIDFLTIQKCVNLLGLPLDGSNSEIHNLMRSNNNHFTIVIDLLKKISLLEVPIKINTVASKINQDDLLSIGELLKNYPIKIWSIYEFWSIGEAATLHSNKHQIDPDIFRQTAKIISDSLSNIRVEIGYIEKRHKAYFFVTQTGRVYTVDNISSSTYVELGTIFDPFIAEDWYKFANRLDSEERYTHRKDWLQRIS